MTELDLGENAHKHTNLTSTTSKVKYVCKECGSENVFFDAGAHWDKDKQELVLEMPVGAAYCSDCGNGDPGSVKKAPAKKFNHAIEIAFTVDSDRFDGEDLTYEDMLRGLMIRWDSLTKQPEPDAFQIYDTYAYEGQK